MASSGETQSHPKSTLPFSKGNHSLIASLPCTCASLQHFHPRSTSPPRPTLHLSSHSHFREKRLHRHCMPLPFTYQRMRTQHTRYLLPSNGGHTRVAHVQQAHAAWILIAYHQLVWLCCIHQEGCYGVVRGVDGCPVGGKATLFTTINADDTPITR